MSVRIVMATYLRVIPNTVYDRLVAQGILERELLLDKLESEKNQKDQPKLPLDVDTNTQTSNSGEADAATEVAYQVSDQEGGGQKECNWFKFEDKFRLHKWKKK